MRCSRARPNAALPASMRVYPGQDVSDPDVEQIKLGVRHRLAARSLRFEGLHQLPQQRVLQHLEVLADRTRRHGGIGGQPLEYHLLTTGAG